MFTDIHIRTCWSHIRGGHLTQHRVVFNEISLHDGHLRHYPFSSFGCQFSFFLFLLFSLGITCACQFPKTRDTCKLIFHLTNSCKILEHPSKKVTLIFMSQVLTIHQTFQQVQNILALFSCFSKKVKDFPFLYCCFLLMKCKTNQMQNPFKLCL